MTSFAEDRLLDFDCRNFLIVVRTAMERNLDDEVAMPTPLALTSSALRSNTRLAINAACAEIARTLNLPTDTPTSTGRKGALITDEMLAQFLESGNVMRIDRDGLTRILLALNPSMGNYQQTDIPIVGTGSNDLPDGLAPV